MLKLKDVNNPDYLIISDFHLGDKSGADDFTYDYFRKIKQAEEQFINIIKQINPTTIILNGDIYDIDQFKYSRIKKIYRKLLHYILTEMNTRYNKGNHDDSLTFGEDVIRIILPNDKNVYISHGHQNDKTMGAWYQTIALRILGFFERFLPGVDNMVVSYLDKKRLGAYPKSKEYAEELLKDDKIDYVVFGHTHIPEIITYDNGVYLNDGTCQNGRFEAVIIDGNNIDLLII